MTFVNLSRAQALQRMEDAHVRMEQIGGKHRSSRSEQAEFDQLAGEFDDFERHVQRLDGAAAVTAGLRTGRYRTQPGTPGADLVPAGGERERAMRTLDGDVRTGTLAARSAEAVESVLSSGPAGSRSWAARWVTATGSPAYKSAFAKTLGNPERGHLEWTVAEGDAWREVAALQAETRAMGIGSVGGGGAMLPYDLDPAIVLSGDGSTHPLLQIARVIPTVSDRWHAVSSKGATAEWLAEHAEAADATPTLAGPAIEAHKASVYVPFSVELEGDVGTLLAELSILLQDAAEQLLAAAYTHGSGSGQPKGLITALVAAASTVPLVGPVVAEALSDQDVYNLQSALPARFQPNASWQASLPVLNALRRMETQNGSLLFPELRNSQPTLLGRPVYENSVMDGLPTAGVTAANHPLVYGDHQRFVITQRIGTAIEFIPHVVGPNRRPTGERGCWLWLRTGSDVLTSEGFRLLAIPTTAA